MPTIKVSFTDPIYTELGREASLAGMSIAQFIREATLVRVAFRRARRGEDMDLEHLRLVRDDEDALRRRKRSP